MESAREKLVHVGPLRVWRSDGGNRLLVGLRAEDAPDWEEGLLALHFRKVPSTNGHAAGAPVYWVLREYDAFTRAGMLHTTHVLEKLHQFLAARRS